jgi:hypothetical protein
MPANVTRFVVQGSTNTPRLWLRLHVDGTAAQPFSCENVEYRTGKVSPCPAPLAPIATAKSTVGATVGATLALTLGGSATFGTFVPGVAAAYTTSTIATLTSTAGDATRRDAERRRPGLHPHGSPGQRRVRPATSAAGHHRRRAADVGGVAGPTTLRTYSGPVSNDVSTLSFRQLIGAGDSLRTGTYAKTLTFAVSTTSP